MPKIRLESGWREVLAEEFEKSYFCELRNFLKSELASKKQIFPPPSRIFAALDRCPWQKTRVVILGQDPYHTPRAANGLCFSVPRSERVPPSLQNIFKEIASDPAIKNFEIPTHGDLESWANQGICLLNATLTVERGKPASHAKKGWEIFTDAIISKISSEKTGVIFLLWGNFAKSKRPLIDESRHTVLVAAHPSPFSANSGFFGCRHFSKVNEILKKQKKPEIIWNLPKSDS